MTAKEIFKAFNAYREFIVDGKKRKELPII